MISEGGVNIGEVAQIDRNGFINFSFTNPVAALARSFVDVKKETRDLKLKVNL